MAWYKSGVISLTNGSDKVTSDGTEFNTYVVPGFGLVIDNQEVYEILAVESNTELTLAKPYEGISKTNHDNWGIYQTQGIIPDLLEATNALHTDYGAVKAEFHAIKDAPSQVLHHLSIASQASQDATEKAAQATVDQALITTALKDVVALPGLQTSVVPSPNKIPIADASGRIDPAWVDLDSLNVQVLNALYPSGVYPSADFVFTGAKRLSDPRITFQRASEATYIDEKGLIKVAGIDEPRFEYDMHTGKSLGLLTEAQATNDAVNSNWYSWLAASGLNDVTYSVDNTIKDPMGGYQAVRVLKTGTNARLASSGSYGGKTRSVYARTVSGTGKLRLLVIQSDRQGKLFDLDETWRRFDIPLVANNQLHIVDFRGGSTLDEVLIWGYQSEESSGVTSLIPTNGTPATRATDGLSISEQSFQSLFNPDAWSIILDAKIFREQNTATGWPAVFMLTSSEGLSYSLRFNHESGSLSFSCYKEDIPESTISAGGFNAPNQPVDLKIGVTISGRKVSLFVNGVLLGEGEISSDYASLISTLTTLYFGTSSPYHPGYPAIYRNIKFYKRALSESQMIVETTE